MFTKPKSLIFAFLTLFIAALLGGCFSSNPADIQAFEKPYDRNVNADSYILQPPDEVEIYCSRVPELHMQRRQIRPDGKVFFESIGEIPAAGKTPKEVSDIIRDEIKSLYSLQGEHPIAVRVMTYRSRVFYVLGEVNFPGPKPATGRDTVFTSIADAQPTVLAWSSRVQVIRPSTDSQVRPKIFEIDFAKMRAHGDLSKNVLLEEGDIIYVPPTVLAAIAMKVEEFVRPIGRAFSTVNIVQGPPNYR